MFREEEVSFRLLKDLNFKLVFNLMAIVLFGILNIYLCTKGSTNSNPFFFTKKQLVWFAISLASMYVVLIFDYKIVYRLVPIIYWTTVVLLIAVWIPGIGAVIKGERGWLNFRLFLFQPAELAKFAVILIMAKLLEDMKGEINEFNNLGKILAYVAIPMILILIQKDMGMTMVCFFIILGIIYMAGLDRKIILSGFAALTCSIVVLWNSGLILKHQKDRIVEFMSGEIDVTGKGYQLFQGMIGIGSGGLFGNEVSLSPAASPGYAGTHVPEIQTDFIFSAIAEQWGFIGSVILLLLYAALIVQILNVARKAQDIFAKIICIGMASYILFAVTQNVGMTLHMLPITGITLPFISYGGSSLWTTMVSMGLIINIELRTRRLLFGRTKEFIASI